MAYKVFISYSQGLNFQAYAMKGDLEQIGAKGFLDMINIIYGQDIEQEILDNIKDCDEIWVLLTPPLQSDKHTEKISGSTHRPYIWLESGVAWNRGIPIVPILLNMSNEEFIANNDIPIVLKRRKAVDLKQIHDYEALLDEIKGKVELTNYYKRGSNRKTINLPIGIICDKKGVCTNAILKDVSDNGDGCYIGTQAIPSNEIVNCFFDVEIVHDCKKYGDNFLNGVGGKLKAITINKKNLK